MCVLYISALSQVGGVFRTFLISLETLCVCLLLFSSTSIEGSGKRCSVVIIMYALEKVNRFSWKIVLGDYCWAISRNKLLMFPSSSFMGKYKYICNVTHTHLCFKIACFFHPEKKVFFAHFSTERVCLSPSTFIICINLNTSQIQHSII